MAKASAKAVDFSNVKDRGEFNPRRVEAGDYLAKVTNVQDGESKKNGEFQYIFTVKLSKFSQHSYPYYCQLKENQLWKLRNLLIAAGLNVPKARMKLDPNKVVGKTIGVTMEDDEYEGKEKSVIGAIFPAAELADSSTDVDEDDDEDEDEDDLDEDVTDDEDDEDTDDSDEDEDEDDEPEPPKKKKKGKKKKKADVEELDLEDL